MGQSIAVLIGNTKYKTLHSLGCCKNDVDQMHALLSATQKFAHIEPAIDRSVSEVTDKIRELAELEGGFEEIFLYFSGHGGSYNDEFYMCFEGWNESAPNSTGLARTEVFELIRLFKAKLSVVVIDACESGLNLIKSDTSPLTKSLKSGLTNFVQISACTENQESHSGDPISVFTKELVKACLKKEQGIVYYTDLENELRDAFLNHSIQTPHFIRQGTAQETFCNDATVLDEFRKTFLVTPDADEASTTQPTILPMAKAELAIKNIEGKVPSEDDAQIFMDRVIEASFSKPVENLEISKFFNIRNVSYDDYHNVDSLKSVINLLNGRSGSDCFITGQVSKKKVRQFAYSSLIDKMYEPEYYDVADLQNNCGLTPVHVGIYFEPNYMALDRLLSEIVFLPRLTECLILTCNSKEPRAGWGDSFKADIGTKKWKWSHHTWKDDPLKAANDYGPDPYVFAKTYILTFE